MDKKEEEKRDFINTFLGILILILINFSALIAVRDSIRNCHQSYSDAECIGQERVRIVVGYYGDGKQSHRILMCNRFVSYRKLKAKSFEEILNSEVNGTMQVGYPTPHKRLNKWR